MLIASAAVALVLLVLLVGLRGRACPGHPASPARLAVEPLEERMTPSTYTVSNIPYGSNPAEVLDIQSDTTYTSAPVVVLIHGGGWHQGDKTNLENVYAAYFLDQGFVVMAPNYQLVTPNGQGGYTNQFPVPIDDVAGAIAWFQANAAAYGANPNEIVLLGNSAGAEIASMLAFDPTGFSNWGLHAPLTGIVGFVGDSGTYDWPLITNPTAVGYITNYLGSFYGNPQWAPTEPITFVDSGDPPALVIDGTGDTLTNYQNSSAFVQAIQSAGGTVTYQLYNGYTHGGFTHRFLTDPGEQAVLTGFLQSIGL
jgi:acetyl esterase/lipase